jgi:nitrous oxidase accessory protein
MLRALGVLLFCMVGLKAVGAEYPPLQPLIDATEVGGELRPAPGTYSGPVVIRKPMKLNGHGKVTIDAGGKGTVVLVQTDGATVSGMRLTNSGGSHNDIDSGVQVRGRYNVISDNIIDNSLFGVDLQQSDNNVVRRNRISSKPNDLGLRGDAIRLWYSTKNQITHNQIFDSRDTVVWYSKDNLIAHNTATRGRYSLHFMYSQYNRVENNRYVDNAVGIFLMYSDSVVVKNNVIAHASGSTGIGVGFKETSDVTIENNQIINCATGIYIDISPYQPDTTNRFVGNRIAYNGVGIQFLSDRTGNIFQRNMFDSNILQVIVNGRGSAINHEWRGNYWDDYQGFDRNRDGGI